MDKPGVFLYGNGDLYCGQWVDKARNEENITEEASSDEEIPCLSHRATPQFPFRVGWGVYIKDSNETYQGQWSGNKQHGIGCLGSKTGNRLIGRFKNDSFLTGVCVSPNGMLYEQRGLSGDVTKNVLFLSLPHQPESPIDHNGSNGSGAERASERADRKHTRNESRNESRNGSGENVAPTVARIRSRTLTDATSAFTGYSRSSSCTSSSASTPSPCREFTGFEEQKVRSNAKVYATWNNSEVVHFAQCLNLAPSVLDDLRAKKITGKMLSDMVMTESLELLFPDPSVNRASRKILHVALTLLEKLKGRLCREGYLQKEVQAKHMKGLRIDYNKVEFESVIGEGGYGRVYKAKWMSMPVATKVFRSRSQIQRDFYAELLCLSRLRHPNITNIVGICVEPRYCILTEFVQCGSLFDLLHHHILMPWSLTRSVSIAREIASGMSFLHARRIVHCDLKSSNILISDCWEVKICDFGLATILRSRTRVSLGCVGTHHWMAPEVLRGEMYTMAADVYSFGMILWETICRKVPLGGLTGPQVIGLVGFGKQKPYIDKGCPKSISAILRGALMTAPHRRHAFRALGAALEKLHMQSFLDVEENLAALLIG